MDIMELGAIGEFVSGVAVVATLVYLAIQVRHGTQMAESALYDETSESWRGILRPAIDEMDVFVRGSKNFEELGESDSVKFAMIVGTIFSYHENFFLKYKRTGLIDQEELDRINRLIAWYIERPGIRDGFWRDYRLLFAETFARHVDGIIERSIAEDRSAGQFVIIPAETP